MTETMISFSSFSFLYLCLCPFPSLFLYPYAFFCLVILSAIFLLFISFFLLFFEFISNHHHYFTHISFWFGIMDALYTFWWIVLSWNSLIWAWYAYNYSTHLFCSYRLYTVCILHSRNLWQGKTQPKSFSRWKIFH